jgi:CRP-like cAMP-binding protein
VTQNIKAEPIRFKAGDVLFLEGSPWNGLYLIQDGIVEIYRESKDLDVQLALLGSGEFIGTATIFSRDPRTAAARAKTDIEVLHCTPEIVHATMDDIPKWARAILKDVISRLKKVDETVVDQSTELTRLTHKFGRPLLHASQLIQLIMTLMKMTDVVVTDRESKLSRKIIPLKTFYPMVESILRYRWEYIESLLNVLFIEKILNKENFSHQDDVIIDLNFDLLEKFSQFCLHSDRSEMKNFLPERYFSLMDKLQFFEAKGEITEVSRADLLKLWNRNGENIKLSDIEKMIEIHLFTEVPEDLSKLIFNDFRLQQRLQFERAAQQIAKLNPVAFA